jgi:hypothetical protein
MELDDYKSAWQALNQKLDQQNGLNLYLLREGRAEKARRGLRPLVWGQAIQMVLGALLILFSVGFWSNHRHVPHLLLTGLLMHAYGLATILFSVRMQVLIHRIDFGAPVVDIQKQLAQLRRFFVVGGFWIGLPWWLLWIPLTIMAFMGLGVDIYLRAPQVITINVAACASGLVLTLLFLRWAQGRPKLAKMLEDSAAGSSLNKAQRRLDEIARFEHPDTQA